MASEEAHKFIRAKLAAMGNPAGDPVNYAVIRPTIDRALKWMDGPQIVQYLGIGGDFVDAASAIDQKIAQYEQQAAATSESVGRAARIQTASEQAQSRLSKGAVETGFAAPPTAAPAAEQGATRLSTPPATGSSVTTADAAVVVWMMRKYGMSESEAADALLDPGTGFLWKQEFIQDGRTKEPGAGRAPSPKQAVERDGKLLVFDPNDGSFVDSGIAADPSYDYQTDAKGDLYAINKANPVDKRLVAAGFDVPKVDPNFTTATDQRTGVTYQVDKRTGQKVPLGQFDFPGIDPEREQTRLELGTQQAGQRLALDTETQRRTRSLAEADFVRNVLASPSDFLFRAALTRGQTSGVPRLTQADIINQFNTDIARLAQPAAASSTAAPTPPTGAAPTGGRLQTFMGSEENPVSPSQGIAGFLAANPGLSPEARANLAAAGGIPVPPAAAPQLDTGSQSMTVAPSVTPARMWTQKEIADLSRQTAPPAVRNIIEGQDPGFVRLPFAAPTRQSLMNLTDSEGQALNTALGAEFGIGAEEVAKATEQRFAPPRQRRAARLLV